MRTTGRTAEDIEAVLRDMLQAYDAGVLSGFRILAGGMFLKPVLLSAGGARYVLRAHTFRNRVCSLEFQAQALEALARVGLHCPRVVRTRSGECGVERDSVCYALHE